MSWTGAGKTKFGLRARFPGWLFMTIANLGDGGLHGVSHREKWLSALGGFLAISLIIGLSGPLLQAQGGLLLLSSMGASCVLLFAVPHGVLSRPWPLVGGHLLSALIGVTLATSVPATALAAALAVSLSLVAMHYLRCLHPPGGATALMAVIGGDAVRELGYGFVFAPVLTNVLILLCAAFLFNYPFVWRRYPQPEASVPRGEKCMIAHSDLVCALSQIDAFIDVTERDLVRIYALALGSQANASGFALETTTEPTGDEP